MNIVRRFQRQDYETDHLLNQCHRQRHVGTNRIRLPIVHAAAECHDAEQAQRRKKTDAKEMADNSLHGSTRLEGGRLRLFGSLCPRTLNGFGGNEWCLRHLVGRKVYDSLGGQAMCESRNVCCVYYSNNQNRRNPLWMRAQVAEHTRWLKENSRERRGRRHPGRRVFNGRQPNEAEREQQNSQRANRRAGSDPANDQSDSGNTEGNYDYSDHDQGNAGPHQIHWSWSRRLSLDSRRRWRLKFRIWIAHVRLSSWGAELFVATKADRYNFISVNRLSLRSRCGSSFSFMGRLGLRSTVIAVNPNASDAVARRNFA